MLSPAPDSLSTGPTELSSRKQPLGAGSSRNAQQACGKPCGRGGARPRRGSVSSSSPPESASPDPSSGSSSSVVEPVLGDLFLGDDLGDDRLRLRVLGLRSCGRLCLCSLERGELLLRRKLPALRDDERLHLDLDVLEEHDRDRVAADPLDRVDPDLPPIDPHLVLVPDPVGDVRRRDRSEQRAGRAGLDVEAENRLLEQPRRSPGPARCSGPRAWHAAPRRARARSREPASPPRRACGEGGSSGRSREPRRPRRRAARASRRP